MKIFDDEEPFFGLGDDDSQTDDLDDQFLDVEGEDELGFEEEEISEFSLEDIDKDDFDFEVEDELSFDDEDEEDGEEDAGWDEDDLR